MLNWRYFSKEQSFCSEDENDLKVSGKETKGNYRVGALIMQIDILHNHHYYGKHNNQFNHNAPGSILCIYKKDLNQFTIS